MIAQDRLEKEKSDARNGVEEYVYDMREKVYSMYEEYVSEEVREVFTEVLFSLIGVKDNNNFTQFIGK